MQVLLHRLRRVVSPIEPSRRIRILGHGRRRMYVARYVQVRAWGSLQQGCEQVLSQYNRLIAGSRPPESAVPRMRREGGVILGQDTGAEWKIAGNECLRKYHTTSASWSFVTAVKQLRRARPATHVLCCLLKGYRLAVRIQINDRSSIRFERALNAV